MAEKMILLFILFWLIVIAVGWFLHCRDNKRRQRKIEAIKRQMMIRAAIKRSHKYGHFDEL